MPSLDPRVRRVFRLLGLLPEQGAPEAAVVALVGGDPGWARTDVRSLLRVHLVEVDDHGRHTQHDLLRAYSRELSGPEPRVEDELGARDRLLAYYAAGCADAATALTGRWGPLPMLSNTAEPDEAAIASVDLTARAGPFEDAETAMAWLNDEHSAIVAVVTAAGPEADSRAIAMVLRLRPFLAVQGWLSEARVLFEDLLERAIRRDDLLAQATALRLLGTLDVNAVEYRSGAQRLARALELSRQIGDRRGTSIALNNIAEMERLLGDPARAVQLLEEALQVNGEAGDLTRVGLNHGNLALAHNALHAYESAEAEGRRALDLAEQVGSENVRCLGLRALADAKLGLGSPSESVSIARQSLELARTFDDAEMLTWSAEVLGRALIANGEFDDAEQILEAAIEASRHSGLLTQLAPSLRALAALREERAPAEAARFLDEARAIGERLRAGALGAIEP